jgi:hypothetical protein
LSNGNSCDSDIGGGGDINANNNYLIELDLYDDGFADNNGDVTNGFVYDARNSCCVRLDIINKEERKRVDEVNRLWQNWDKELMR